MLKNLAPVLLLLTASLSLQGSVRLAPAPSFPLRSTATYNTRPASSIPCAGKTSLSGFFQVSIAPNGNLVKDGRFNYTWDAENRLVSAIWANHTKVEYCYDYMGRRIEKKVSNWSSESWQEIAKLKYVYDGWNCIAEFDANSNLLKSYAWGEDLSGSLQGAGGVGGLVCARAGPNDYFPVYDGNGNVTSYLDSSGNISASYEYDPFGRTIVKAGTKADDFAFRFSTKYIDETGLYYFGYRYYEPQTGRFLNRDLIEEGGGNNLFAYCNNAPIKNIDPLGKNVYLVYRPLNIIVLEHFNKPSKIGMEFVSTGHVYLAFDGESMGDEWSDILNRMKKHFSGLATEHKGYHTFSFHPWSVRHGEYTNDGYFPFHADSSDVFYNDPYPNSDLDSLSPGGKATKVQVTDKKDEQCKIFIETLFSWEINSRSAKSNDNGYYSFLTNNCQHWAERMIRQAGVQVPSNSFNIGVTGAMAYTGLPYLTYVSTAPLSPFDTVGYKMWYSLKSTSFSGILDAFKEGWGIGQVKEIEVK